jgi:hypothetical protein
MDENFPGLLLCSKSKCRAVLPVVQPWQKNYKTCQKCQDQNRIHMNRKREGEHLEGLRQNHRPNYSHFHVGSISACFGRL